MDKEKLYNLTPRLAYLDLEFPKTNKRKTIDDIPFMCFHSDLESYKHIFHQEKSQATISSVINQLNCLCDICYLCNYNLSIVINSVFSLRDLSISISNKIEKQQKELDSKIDQLLLSINTLPSKSSFADQSTTHLVDQITDKFSKIRLGNQKTPKTHTNIFVDKDPLLLVKEARKKYGKESHQG